MQCIMVKFDVSSSGFRALLSPPALPTVGRFPSAGAARFDPQTRKEWLRMHHKTFLPKWQGVTYAKGS